MKRKLLCIAVAVIMILPLAFAAIPTAFAAGTLGSSWSQTVSGGALLSPDWGERAGTLTVDDNGAIIMEGTSVHGGAGVIFNSKVKVDGLTIKLGVAIANEYNLFASATVFLSRTAFPGDFVAAENDNPNENIWSGLGYSTSCNTATTAAYSFTPNTDGTALLHGSRAFGLVKVPADNPGALTVANGSDITIKFVVNGDNIDLYVDGNKAEGFSVPKASVLDVFGNAYLAFDSNSYGGAHVTATVSEINGQTANNYTEQLERYVINTTCSILGGPEANGVLETNNNGELFLNNTAAGWFARVGIAYAEKVAVDGLEIKFVMDNIDESNTGLSGLPARISQYMNINLSKDKATDFVGYDCNGTTPDIATMKNPMAGNATGLNVTASTSASLIFMLLSDRTSWTATGGMYSAIPHTYANPVGTYADNAEHTVKFEKNGDNIDILIDGEVAMSFVAADVLDADGKAYLSFSANSFGNSAANMTIKTINGQAANEFVPEAATNDPVIVGAKYRTEGVAGIRFLTEVALNDVNNNETIKKMGTLIIPADKLGDAELVLTENGKIGETSYLDIVAKNYYEKTDDMISFTAVLIGIPENQLDRDFVAVSYIVYEDGTVTYSAPCVRNIAALMA